MRLIPILPKLQTFKIKQGKNQMEIAIPIPEKVKLADLKFDGKNPNKMTKEQRARLRKSIEKFGDIIPIIGMRTTW
jgi:hypothetical protein